MTKRTQRSSKQTRRTRRTCKHMKQKQKQNGGFIHYDATDKELLRRMGFNDDQISYFARTNLNPKMGRLMARMRQEIAEPPFHGNATAYFNSIRTDVDSDGYTSNDTSMSEGGRRKSFRRRTIRQKKY